LGASMPQDNENNLSMKISAEDQVSAVNAERNNSFEEKSNQKELNLEAAKIRELERQVNYLTEASKSDPSIMLTKVIKSQNEMNRMLLTHQQYLEVVKHRLDNLDNLENVVETVVHRKTDGFLEEKLEPVREELQRNKVI